ncbi:MAG: ECF transporter S component [Ruminococcaceae bacterium]|nr:ECF transporter S component [Oscillospiraceae bacterium]
MNKNKTHIQRLVGTAVLAALVVILQFFVSIPVGIFTITLTLVPIMIGAILFGPATGAFLGGVFGAVVSIQVVTGAAGVISFAMFEYTPVITIALCLLKGIAAGLVSGLIFRLFEKLGKTWLGTVLSAIACPITNTGIFAVGVLIFYQTLLGQWAIEYQFASAISFLMIGMIGLNFVVEFAINVAIIPVVMRVITVVKKKF